MEPDIRNARPYGVLSTLMDEIDDWCGTRPRGPFPPRPPALRDAMLAVAIHTLAERIEDGQMRQQIQSQAGQLYRTAGKSIAG